jgi:hypothetical protein
MRKFYIFSEFRSNIIRLRILNIIPNIEIIFVLSIRIRK